MNKIISLVILLILSLNVYTQDKLPRQVEKDMEKVGLDKHINFEGISMDNAWNMLLEFEYRGYKYLATEFGMGVYVNTYKGVYGPRKEEATISQAKPQNVDRATCIMVLLKTHKTSIFEIRSYLMEKFGKPIYHEKGQNYEYKLDDGRIYLMNHEDGICVMYMVTKE